MVECTRLESEQTVKGLGSSNLPLSVESWGGTAPQPPPARHLPGHTRGTWVKVLSVFFVAVLVLCSSGARGAETVAVDGTVTKAPDGRAARGARVSISMESGRSISVFTDKDGRYAAIGIDAGEIRVDVQFAGDLTPYSTCRVPSGERARQDFTLEPLPRTIGMIRARKILHCRIEPDTSDKTIIE